MTPDEIIDEIAASNGDGCDYIYYIKNLTTGKMLLEEYNEEDDQSFKRNNSSSDS